MSTGTTTRCQPLNFIPFHGANLLVVKHDGVEYTAAKTVSDVCGLFWKSTKRTISQEENAFFYGVKVLLPPEIDDFGTTSGPKTALYMRLDRVHMFISRISTANVRAKGNIKTADFLLKLQMEWADALYRYETHGIAIKPGRHNALNELLQMTRLRNQLSAPEDRRYVDQLIHEGLHALGQSVDSMDDDQLPLFPATTGEAP